MERGKTQFTWLRCESVCLCCAHSARVSECFILSVYVIRMNDIHKQVYRSKISAKKENGNQHTISPILFQ